MSWYKQIRARHEDTFVGFTETDEDMESYAGQAWILAADNGLDIQSNKELARVAVLDGKLLGALWTGWNTEGGFSFDVVVDPQYRRQGIGSNLVDQAVSLFGLESKGFVGPYFDIITANEDMTRILEKKGLVTGK